MKGTKPVFLLAVLVVMILAAVVPGIAMAQDETTTTPPDSLTMTTEFPAIEAIATGTFAFNVVMNYIGATNRVFNLNATAPAGWDVYVTPQYDTQRISSISVEASTFAATSKTVKLTATPQTYPLPDPGDYQVTLEASSGEVVGKIDLTARITAKYVLNAVPYSQLYNTTASAGRDNIYSLVITNVGTAPIDNITFSSEKPDGWEITFKPEKLDLLNTLEPNTVDVNVKPPPKTVAGDYMITLHVSGKQATATAMDVRVTVKTPSIWGWVGVFIIVIVVAGLIFTFMRFGRR